MDPPAHDPPLAETSRPSKRSRKGKEKEITEKTTRLSKNSPTNFRLTWSLLHPILTRRGVSDDFRFVIPKDGQTAENPPAGCLSWYYHQFEGGLTFPIPSFMSNIATNFGIPLNRLHQTAFKFITCFFVVCKVLNFFPSASLFFAFFLVKASDIGIFHFNGRQGHILLTGNAPKIKDWQRFFFYVRLPTKGSWGFSLGPHVELNRSDPDPECIRVRKDILNLLPEKHAFNVEQILDCSALVASTGFWPLPQAPPIPDRSTAPYPSRYFLPPCLITCAMLLLPTNVPRSHDFYAGTMLMNFVSIKTQDRSAARAAATPTISVAADPVAPTAEDPVATSTRGPLLMPPKLCYLAVPPVLGTWLSEVKKWSALFPKILQILLTWRCVPLLPLS